MARGIDLTGRRFGMLTVIRLSDRRHYTKSGHSVRLWECRCDCGVTTEVMAVNLMHGHTTSCGCLQRESAKDRGYDLSGQRFGRWTVIERAPVPAQCSDNDKTGWLCRCDCGAERIVRTSTLMSGKSLGCPKCRGQARRPLKNAGVSYRAKEHKWVAYIGDHGKTKFLGRFKTYEEAVAARKKAEEDIK